MIHRTVLDNGITVIAAENPVADIISGRIFLKTGSFWEPRDKAGLCHLLASVLTKGTENLSSVEIAERVESIGASLGADAASDYFLISFKTVSGDFEQVFDLAKEILRSPTFPEAEVNLERNLTLQDIRSQQEQPFNLAFKQLRSMMYQEHPYGISILGTETSVPTINRSDLQHYHQTYFRPDNLVVSLAGRLTHTQAVESVQQVLGDWQVPSHPSPSSPIASITSRPSIQEIPQETQQSIVMLGYLGASVKETDYLTLKLLNTYLGNGLSSRLFVELREKRGLAYDVSAFYPTRLNTSQFVVYMGTAADNIAIAVDGLHREVERLCQIRLTESELQTAKNKLLGQYALGKQTNAELAHIFGWYETLGLGIEFDTHFQKAIAEITPQMIQNVAQHYFTEPYISLVGPQKALEKWKEKSEVLEQN